jgi:hypothetical protein
MEGRKIHADLVRRAKTIFGIVDAILGDSIEGETPPAKDPKRVESGNSTVRGAGSTGPKA